MTQEALDVRADAFFLSRDELYQTEKLYRLQEPSNFLPRTNVKTDKINGLLIQDMRGKEHEYTFDEQGFAVLEMESGLPYEEFSDPQKVENVYLEELGACLLKYMKGSSIQFFDRVIRRRYPTFPLLTNDTLPTTNFQPAMLAHLDATHDFIASMVEALNGDDAGQLLQNRYIYVNIWKPLKGPVQDWPLALCDASSIKKEDLVPCDIVSSTEVTENVILHFNSGQRWHYLSNQLPSELLVFRQIDSLGVTKPPVPHMSFSNPLLRDKEAFCRESIEVRAVIYFDG